MKQWLENFYLKSIHKYPILALLLLIVCLAGLVPQIQKLRFDASSDSLVVEGDSALALFRDVGKRYATEDFLIVTYAPKSNDLFSDATLGTIAKMQAQLSSLPEVSSVNSIVNVPLLYSPKASLVDLTQSINYLSEPDTDRTLAAQEFKHSPIYSGLLTSADEKTTVIQVNLHRNEALNELREQRDVLRQRLRNGDLTLAEKHQLANIEEQYEILANQNSDIDKALVAQVRDILNDHRSNAQVFLGGITMITNDMLSFIQQDLLIFGLAIFIFIVFVLGVVFRQLRWVVLPMMTCVACVLATTGLMAMLGWKLTVISANFVALLLILTLSVTVHLVVRYRELEVKNPQMNIAERVHETVSFMFKPCLFTTLTTIVAFASLVVSGIRPVIDFGWMMTLGVVIALLVTFIVIPAGALLWKGKAVQISDKEVSQTPPMTAYIANFAEKFSKPIVVISIALGLVSLYGVSQLKVENRFIDYFDESTEIYQGMETIDAELGGVIPLDIIVRHQPSSQEDDGYFSPDDSGDDFADVGDINETTQVLAEDDFADVDTLTTHQDEEDDFAAAPQMSNASSFDASYWFTQAGLEEIEKIHHYIDGLEETGKTLSLATLSAVAQDLLGTRVDDIQLALLQRRVTGQIKRALVDPYLDVDKRETRITVRVKETSRSLNRNQLIKKIDTFMQEEMGYKQAQYDLTGLLVLYNNMLQSLFRSQILTLGAVFIAIILMFLVLFRSLKIALIAILPNLLAAGLVLGCMGLLGIPLDLMTITIAAITVGIGVDNSIHYIYRFKSELANDGNYLQTMHRSHRSIGRAMFYTSITIIVGFSILVLSNFTPSIYFGFLTAFAMLSALTGNLLLLPQLLMIFKPFPQTTAS